MYYNPYDFNEQKTSIVDFERVSSTFGWRDAPKAGASRNHKGVDLAAGTGTTVRAAEGGIITRKEYQKGYGNVVYVRHNDGSETRYAHLNDFADIHVNMPVKRGTILGEVGSTGNSTGPHLHFEYRDKNGVPQNPLKIYGYNLDQAREGSSDNYTPEFDTYFDYGNYLNAQIQQKKQDDINHFLSFEVKAEPQKKEEENTLIKDIVPSLMGGNLFGALLGAAIVSAQTLTKEETKPQEETQTLQLTTTDLYQKGFSVNEIQLLSRLAQAKQTQGASATLAQNAQCITQTDMQQLGFSDEKISLLTAGNAQNTNTNMA